MSEDKTVATALVEALRALGVKYVFGVPSGGWVDYMEALRTADGIAFVLTSHEGAAGMMADVCGRLTGVPGVCFGTFGPGATNLATGVGEALLDRSPVIALTDEMPAAMLGRTTQMGIDHQALFRPLTKMTTRLRAEAVKSTLFDAARVALSVRPGSVHVGLPVGLSARLASAENVAFVPPAPPPPADPALLDQAAKLFAGARKPILAAGLGAVHAKVGKEIRELAEKHGIPVVLTPMAKGLLQEDHPSYAGVLFHALSNIVGETHRQADLVVAIGYDPVEFNYEIVAAAIGAARQLRRGAGGYRPDGIPPRRRCRGRHSRRRSRALLRLAPARTDWDLAAVARAARRHVREAGAVR